MRLELPLSLLLIDCCFRYSCCLNSAFCSARVLYLLLTHLSAIRKLSRMNTMTPATIRNP